MQLERLHIEAFRNIASSQLELAPRINLVCGANASGKTSLLEAIHCLGFGRSFRTHQIRHVIQEEHDAFTLFAKLRASTNDSEASEFHRVGYRRFRNGDTQIKVNGASEKRFSTLARLMPVQLITPESVELIIGGPKLRRQFMDWGLFHVEHSLFPIWSSYVRLLKQRNALLRQGLHHRQDGVYWDEQLATVGEQVADARLAYVDSLNLSLNDYCQRFLPEYDFRFKLNHGWARDEYSLSQILLSRQDTDRRQGFTSVGPHKAEWQIKVDGVDARERLSRGQLKLLVAALRLVQAHDYKKKRGQSCIILVDDLPAELDEKNQHTMCRALYESGSQVFVTAIDEDRITSHFHDTETQLFHVEHGTILCNE